MKSFKELNHGLYFSTLDDTYIHNKPYKVF